MEKVKYCVTTAVFQSRYIMTLKKYLWIKGKYFSYFSDFSYKQLSLPSLSGAWANWNLSMTLTHFRILYRQLSVIGHESNISHSSTWSQIYVEWTDKLPLRNTPIFNSSSTRLISYSYIQIILEIPTVLATVNESKSKCTLFPSIIKRVLWWLFFISILWSS